MRSFFLATSLTPGHDQQQETLQRSYQVDCYGYQDPLKSEGKIDNKIPGKLRVSYKIPIGYIRYIIQFET